MIVVLFAARSSGMFEEAGAPDSCSTGVLDLDVRQVVGLAMMLRRSVVVCRLQSCLHCAGSCQCRHI